jgi:hypothetical protein
MGEATEFVEVGGKKYVVIKMGRAQAEQVLAISRWISAHGFKVMSVAGAQGQSIQADNAFEFLSKIIDLLTADALIDLFVALVGCPKEDAEIYFDIGILVDVILMVYEEQPAVRRLIDRFFSTPVSEEKPEE